jgi:trimethylamine--corrinoid protein Co-methyltransferase
MIVTFAELLTPEQVRRIHEGSLEILERVGLLVRNDKARQRLARHGCRVEADTQIVKFPRRVVEHFRAAFPPTFTFHGRDPQYDRTIPGDGPLIVTGSSAPNIIDPLTGEERRSRSDDIARIAHLINELPGYDIFSISTLADDAPPGQFSLSRFYPAIKNCLKPVRGNTPSREEAEMVLRLGALVAGNEDAYQAHPFFTHHCCPVVSPLTMDFDSTDSLMFFTEKRLPNYATIVPNAGLTAPLTLTGTLVQCNAEFLAQATLMQMTHPGTPLIYATLPTVADMRTGAYAPGAIETGILVMGCVQMARHYNVPSGAYIGLTNAKVNDAQSGYETGMSTLAGVLAGADMLNMGGLLDALMAFDFAKAVIDDEIARMLKQVKRGLAFSEEDLALDLIAQVGPGGMFMDKLHTMQRMKTAALLPEIADRDMRDAWKEQGSLDAQARAMMRVREILTKDNPAVFAPEVDAHIRAEFEGLVAGDSVPPAGWEPLPAAAPAARRHTRRRRAAQ